MFECFLLACATVAGALDLSTAPPELMIRALIVVQIAAGITGLLMLARGLLGQRLSHTFIAGLLLLAQFSYDVRTRLTDGPLTHGFDLWWLILPFELVIALWLLWLGLSRLRRS